jgi:hypothetical protein
MVVVVVVSEIYQDADEDPQKEGNGASDHNLKKMWIA